MKNLIYALFFTIACFAASAAAQTVESVSCPETYVCLTQAEANEAFRLAEIGKKHPAYVARAEADIKQRDEALKRVEIALARAVQDAINLSNQATRDNAALEQYRQYFFAKGRPKCIGACVQFGNK